jgi:hypothetical protein
MTQQEVSRAEICLQINRKKLSQAQASKELGLSLRQVQRIYKIFIKEGIAGLVSKKRGKPSNHQLPVFLKARILELVTCDRYVGFKPTFMCEKLELLHQITISPETTRQLMIQSGVWKPKGKKYPIIHQQRKRRARVGELLQIDGSPHAWFEDRGDPCVLLVYIDDATGHTYGRFAEAETTADYMMTTREYITKYGRPLAIYSDKHGIFRVNAPGCVKRECFTQFGRALKELDIHLICANSPQAKGRVERANKTLQDRLVKELRLAGINTIDGANKFLNGFWEIYNEKFNVMPANKNDAHRQLFAEHDLDRILCFKETRKVSKNLEIQYKNIIYQIDTNMRSKSLIRARVTVLEGADGRISIEYNGHPLSFKEYAKQQSNGEEVNSKEIDRFLREKKMHKISFYHPWLQEGRVMKNRSR